MSHRTQHWKIDVDPGDLIHVETENKHAVLEVRGIVGNEIIYQCVVSDGEYYGTKDDDRMLHKQNLIEDSFWIDQE